MFRTLKVAITTVLLVSATLVPTATAQTPIVSDASTQSTVSGTGGALGN